MNVLFLVGRIMALSLFGFNVIGYRHILRSSGDSLFYGWLYSNLILFAVNAVILIVGFRVKKYSVPSLVIFVGIASVFVWQFLFGLW